LTAAGAGREGEPVGVSRILVLDDLPENLRLIGELLSDADAEVSFAKTGQQALRLVARVDFQLAILDLNLPDIDGFEVGERIRVLQPGCELIFCSAHNERVHRDRAFNEGAIDFIEKPFELGATRRRLRTHLERLALKMRLQSEKDKLDTMIASIPDAVISVDDAGRIVMWNASAEGLFGVSADEALGGEAARFLPLAVLAPTGPSDAQDTDRAGEGAAPAHIGAVRRDGRRVQVEVKRSHWWQDGRRYTTHILRDVTERAVLLEALKRAKEDAEKANRAKSDFLANMSHEIRTPMNAVIGMTHLALRQTADTRARGYLDKIQQSARHLLGLINDILDFSKIEADKLTLEHIEFALSEVLENFSNLVAERAAAKGLELIFDVRPGVPEHLVGDPLRLAQILVNYGHNAVKFTERGEIVLSVALVEEDPTRVLLRFAVRDTGIGITDDLRPRLFRSFEQGDTSTSRQFGGTGLGLVIASRLATLMGGDVGVDSAAGAGSTFWFTARLGRGDPRLGARRQQARLLGLRVLVVDDNEVARTAQADALRRLGFRPGTASGGGEALEAVRRADADGDPYAAVIVDGQMPGMDGVETAARLRAMALRQAPRLLLATAYGDDDLVRRAAEGTFAAVLAKPITPSSLHDRLLEVFHVAWPPPPVPAAEIGGPEGSAHVRDPGSRPDGSDGGVEDPAPRPDLPASTYSPGAAVAQGPLGGLHVLVVDDNEINLLIAREMLVSAGATVDTAEDGQQAVERLRVQRFDLVLMDMQMPVMDGLEATRRIRELPGGARLPVLAMTANAMAADRERCLQAGMDEVLTKPIDPSLLLEMVAQWGRVPAQPSRK